MQQVLLHWQAAMAAEWCCWRLEAERHAWPHGCSSRLLRMDSWWNAATAPPGQSLSPFAVTPMPLPPPAPFHHSLAEAAAGTLQAMNPLVHVTCLPGAASRVTDPETVRGFDLVIITAQPLSVMQQADAACRQVGASFMAAAVQGVGSFLFLDLGQHSFRPKVGLVRGLQVTGGLAGLLGCWVAEGAASPPPLHPSPRPTARSLS